MKIRHTKFFGGNLQEEDDENDEDEKERNGYNNQNQIQKELQNKHYIKILIKIIK